MKIPNFEQTSEVLKFINVFLKTFIDSVETKNNQVICQSKIKTEITIEDINKTAFDGIKIKRRFSAITHFPFLDAPFVGTLNNFSALSSFIVNKDDKTNKFVCRFFEYEGETIQEQFLIPSLLTTTICNERMLHTLTKKIISKVDEKSIDYDASESRWSRTAEFEEVQSKLDKKFACSASKTGITVEFPWENGAISAVMGHKTALLEIRTDNKHPYFGAGLFCKLTLPITPIDKIELSNSLNMHEFSLEDAPPLVGSWCTGGEKSHMVFVAFFPNHIYHPNIILSIIMWMNFRTQIAKSYLDNNQSLIS